MSNFYLYSELSLRRKTYVNTIIYLLATKSVVEFTMLRQYLDEKKLSYDYKTITKFTKNFYFNIIRDGESQYLTLGDNSFQLLNFSKQKYLPSYMYSREEYNKILLFENTIGRLDFNLISSEVAIYQKDIYYYSDRELECFSSTDLEKYNLNKLRYSNILTENAEFIERHTFTEL